MPRWLLPLIAVLALCGRAVTAYAAAGWVGNTECCCPDPKTCKCHDHEGKERPQAELKRCGGDATQVAPDMTKLAIPAPIAIATEQRIDTVFVLDAPILQSAPPVPPEPPPI